MTNEKERLESIKQMRLGTSQLEREREYWTSEEREQLIRMYTDLVGNVPRRQRSERKPVCLCCKCLIHDGCPFYQSMQHITEDD